MDALLNKERPEVRLRAFRAIDDPRTCDLFVQGHEQVLTSIGVTKVTSSSNAWASNPGSFVVIVESLDGNEVYAGARVHVAGGSEPLPIEQATAAMDPNIRSVVYKAACTGTGEICGLWSAKEIAGYRMGNILFRAATAICTQIRLTSLFALCAPYTLYMVKNVGFGILEEVGNNGTFYYPKLDLLATAVHMNEIVQLHHALEEDREMILKLREDPNAVMTEERKSKQMLIHYDLRIPRLDAWDLQAIIDNAGVQFHSLQSPGTPNVSFL